MILGIDEVGRGPWAGPLVIGAVVLGNPEDAKWTELTDSKKLTAKKREKLNTEILEGAVATSFGWVEAKEIDELGLAEALKLAARRAVEKIPQDAYDEIIIDGTQNFLKGTKLENKVTVLKKADLLIKEVSAASIIAKVARDNYMIKLVEKYPEYGFEKHVGYGTAAHKIALEKHGHCPEHRKSFRPIAKLLGIAENADTSASHSTAKTATAPSATRLATTTAKGNKAERIVADFLEQNGHKILARNYKTKFYEIDIISATKDHIYFTEVKYRKSKKSGSPLEAIDKRKQKQMVFAANAFTKFLSKKLNRSIENLPSPILAAAAVSGTDFHLDAWLKISI